MTGLKSGSGDDLWSDDGDESEEEADEAQAETTENEGAESDDAETETEGTGTEEADETQAETEETTEPNESEDEPEKTEADETEAEEGEAGEAEESADETPTRPYIVRRAVLDKSVQFERDERLTFFVHEDVADGERALVTEVESLLGRDVPKFDVREAVYRAALRNPDDVLDALLEMGYSLDEE
ncbi:hypothetical protein [Halorussus amylolyticus]|uniref:hypothetical protein n=1 Tax=Halorussus amylolyticus TaxID=1126242 RepID=UPI001051B63B|nr:hypothetical protein [Halorussus amylolyticus]